MAANVTSMISLLSSMKAPQGVNPVTVKLPPPPPLEGALAPNDFLTRAQAYALNAIRGPESMVIVNRYIYTGLKDGWIVEIQPSGRVRRILRMSIRNCDHPGAGEGACGRPLGVRADSRGFLVVADAYNGIFRIHPGTGQFRQLVNARNQVVNGRRVSYINDLAVAKDGTIYFTSSSTKWKPSQMLNIMFEGETSGRVLMYNPRELLAARRVQELVSNLHYPNGVQLSPDGQFLLIGEGGRSKIHRAWIVRGSPNFGKIETFADNLPGNVDNIRLSPRGTYWVGLSRARHSSLPSVMDSYGEQPEIRRNLITLVNNNMVFDDPSFGIVVELNARGQIVRSLQDPTGSKYTSVSEVGEEKGLLFIASKRKNFIGILDLNTLPPPVVRPNGDSGLAGLSLPQGMENMDVQELLSKVSQELQRMEKPKVRSIVLLLVRHLYQAKMEAKRANEEVSRLREKLDYLKMHAGGGTPPGGGSGTGGSGDMSPGGLTSPGSVTDWPLGGGGGAAGGGGAFPTTTSSYPDMTTTSPRSASSTSTTGSGMVIPPDMSGSSALTGSVDGGVVGGASSLPTPSPSDNTSTRGTGGGGVTTQAALPSPSPTPTTTTPEASATSSQGTGSSTTVAAGAITPP